MLSALEEESQRRRPQITLKSSWVKILVMEEGCFSKMCHNWAKDDLRFHAFWQYRIPNFVIWGHHSYGAHKCSWLISTIWKLSKKTTSVFDKLLCNSPSSLPDEMLKDLKPGTKGGAKAAAGNWINVWLESSWFKDLERSFYLRFISRYWWSPQQALTNMEEWRRGTRTLRLSSVGLRYCCNYCN